MRTLPAAIAALVLPCVALAGPVEDAAKLKKQGKHAEAVALLEKASEAKPADCGLRKALASAYFDAGDGDLGAMTAERFVKDCASDPEAAAFKERLIQHYDSIAGAEAPPDEAGPGGVYLVPLPPRKLIGGRTEDDAWAFEHDARVDRLPPVEEAIEQMRAGAFDKAAAVLEATVKKKPGDAQAWRWLGTARGHLGDAQGATKAYEKYLKLDPKAPDAEPIRKSIKFVKGGAAAREP